MSKDIMTTGKKMQVVMQSSRLQGVMPVATQLVIWLLSLVAVCLVYDYDTHMELLHDCPDNNTITTKANFSYPLRVSTKEPLFLQCQDNMTQLVLERDFHQECNLFLLVGLCTMVVSAAIVTKQYLQNLPFTQIHAAKFDKCHQSSFIFTLIGILLHMSMSILWLASSIILSDGIRHFKTLVSFDSILMANTEFCSEYNCRLEVEPSCSPLWVAVCVGVICGVIWLLLTIVSFLRALQKLRSKTKSSDPKVAPHTELGVTAEQNTPDVQQEECQRFVNIPLSPVTPFGQGTTFRDPIMGATPRNILDLNISLDFNELNKKIVHV